MSLPTALAHRIPRANHNRGLHCRTEPKSALRVSIVAAVLTLLAVVLIWAAYRRWLATDFD